MNIVFISDLHATIRLPMAKVDEGGTSSDRLRDVLSILRQVGHHAEVHDVDAVFVAGDLFDQQHPDGATLVHTSRALRDLASRCEVFLLPGNHDGIGRDGRMYNLDMYAELKMPNLKVLKHEFFDLDSHARIHAMPWLPNERAQKRLREARNHAATDKFNLLVMHQDIKGAMWDSGMPSTEGLMADEVCEGWDFVVSGHYHRPQKFGRCGMFCGAPLDLKFGDEEYRRGFWTFNTATKKLKRVETDYPGFATVRFRLEEGDDVMDGYQMRSDTVTAVQAPLYYRIVVSGPKKELARATAPLRHFFDRHHIRHVRIDLQPDREESVRRIDVEPSISMPEMARRYVQAKTPDGTNPDELLSLGLSFLE